MNSLSKAARNEKRKLTATFINNVALTFLVAGVATPYFAWINLPLKDVVRIIEEFPAGVRITPIAALAASFAISGLLHWTARSILEDVED